MQVLTLDNTEFIKLCKLLECECSECKPDLIVGIANGGVYVSELMFNDMPHFNIKLQRASGKLKSKRFVKLISKLPRPFLDLMRIGEAYYLSLKGHKFIQRTINVPENLIEAIQKANSILIVDDAVDSGVTMRAIAETCKSFMGKNSSLHTAAITITTFNPVIRPDYYIFDNRTMIRFPWSIDSK